MQGPLEGAKSGRASEEAYGSQTARFTEEQPNVPLPHDGNCIGSQTGEGDPRGSSSGWVLSGAKLDPNRTASDKGVQPTTAG